MDLWLRFDQVFLYPMQLIGLRSYRENNLHRHQGKLITNTYMRPASKRQIRKWLATSGTCIGETFRVKALWLIPKSWMTMNYIWADIDCRIRWNIITTNLIRYERMS